LLNLKEKLFPFSCEPVWTFPCYIKNRNEAEIKNLAYEELTMSIQKKSLLNTLNTTKKAIVASSTAPSQANPGVSAPVSARLRARIMPRTRARVVPKVVAKKKV
jgi:hypothetical protein